MGKPAGGEYLSDDITYLARNKFTHLVSLLEVTEASELGLSLEQEYCQSNGLHFEQFPIRDRDVPEAFQKFVMSLEWAYDAICSGANLIAHCRAGIGRSGIYTTSILIRHGFSADDAFALVSEARGFSIPDTQAQIEWIHEHEKELRGDV